MAKTTEDVCKCGHAIEAHGDSEDGCYHCDCSELHGRVGAGGEGGSTVAAPAAEGGT